MRLQWHLQGPREEVLAYQTRPTYGSLHTMAVAYAEAINGAVREDTLHPGMYADYGVALAMMGQREEACLMLNAEVRSFPESRRMVQRIKQQMLPDMMSNDQVPPFDTLDVARVRSWQFDAATANSPLPVVAAVIDSTDRVWIDQQTPSDSVARQLRLTANQKRERLEQEQYRQRLEKQMREDSIAAAKQAKVDARKQAVKQKDQQKKDKEKAKKAEAKAKQKALKEKQKQKEAEAKAKKQQKEAEAAAKQQQKEAEAAAKKQQKEAEAAAKKQQKEAEAAAKRQQKEAEAKAKQAEATAKKGGKQ